MTAVYPIAVDTAITRLIDGHAIKARLVGPGFTYDETDTMGTDIDDPIGTAVTVTVDRIEGGALYVDPVTFHGVPAGTDVTGVVFYLDADSILCHIDRRADTVPIEITPDGGDITLTFDRLLKL